MQVATTGLGRMMQKSRVPENPMADMDPPLKLRFPTPYIFSGEKKNTLRTVHRKFNSCVLSHPKEVVSLN